MIDKIKPTIAIGAEVRLIFSETESIECAWIFFGDLNGYEILIAQPVDNQDFCGKSAHWRPCISFRFTLRLEKPITSSTAEQHEEDDDKSRPDESASPILFSMGRDCFQVWRRRQRWKKSAGPIIRKRQSNYTVEEARSVISAQMFQTLSLPRLTRSPRIMETVIDRIENAAIGPTSLRIQSWAFVLIPVRNLE
jgi:hypothetical protein